MTMEEMREFLMKSLTNHLHCWYSYEIGDDPTEALNNLKTESERIQFGFRMILLTVVPKMTKQTHRLSEFKEELPIFINTAPEIVSHVLSEQFDYSFGYYCKDIPYTFTQIPWRKNV